MAEWHFYGVVVEPIETENLSTVIELLRARLGTYRWKNGISICRIVQERKRGSRRDYYHIPPKRRIETRSVRPGSWPGSWVS